MAKNQPPQPSPSKPSKSSGTAVKDAPKKSPPKLDQLPQFRVLLHNDEVSAMDDVVRSIQMVAAHPLEMAVRIMLEAHDSGLALVTITHKERAELMQEQFQAFALTCTIEPAD